MKVTISNIVKYEFFILVGALMAVGALVKLLGYSDFSSDWFWFLAGVGLTIEGVIAMFKQRKFDKKFKIIEVSR